MLLRPKIALTAKKHSYGRNNGFCRITAFSSQFLRFRCFGKKSLSVAHYHCSSDRLCRDTWGRTHLNCICSAWWISLDSLQITSYIVIQYCDAVGPLGDGKSVTTSDLSQYQNSLQYLWINRFMVKMSQCVTISDTNYTLRRPVMREVLSTRIWGVPPAGGSQL